MAGRPETDKEDRREYAEIFEEESFKRLGILMMDVDVTVVVSSDEVSGRSISG